VQDFDRSKVYQEITMRPWSHVPRSYVKNLVPHNALYNYGRMQEVWLDK